MRTLLPKVFLIVITALSLMCDDDEKNTTVVDVFFTEQPMGGRAVDTLICKYTLYYRYEYTPPLIPNADYENRSVVVTWHSSEGRSGIVKTGDLFNFKAQGTTPPEIWVDSSATLAAAPGEHLSGPFWLEISVDGPRNSWHVESNHVECFE